MMAVKEKRGAFGVALQAVFDDATVDAFMDGDFSRFASLVQADLFLQQFPEDGFLALGTFSPAFRVAAFPRLESMGTRGFSVSDVVPLLEQRFKNRWARGGFPYPTSSRFLSSAFRFLGSVISASDVWRKIGQQPLRQ